MLPDEILLVIFDLFVDQDVDQPPHLPGILRKKDIETWQTLVHVCPRWRSVVFGSPRRLKLRLVCTVKTPARDTLDVWPAFPLIIHDGLCFRESFDNIMALLEHSDRVCQINLGSVPNSHMEKLSEAMQEPFSELTLLVLSSRGTLSVLPDSLLGGSAPRLRKLWLEGIPFPGLPKLLLSATHLVYLILYDIPRSGYISPEAMFTALSTLTALERLSLGFISPQSFPKETRPPLPPTRSLLPLLTYFWFQGISEYLDDLMARIDTPRVNKLYITLFSQIVFDTPQFIQFIGRTPALKAFKKAHLAFDDSFAYVILSSKYGLLHVGIECAEFNWQVSSLEQICTSSIPPLSTLEDLYIYENESHPDWQDNVENSEWLELLHPFSAVKDLYISRLFTPLIGSALQELIGGRMTEVLPTLRNIFLEGLEPSEPVQESVWQFVAARQVSQHIAVSRWNNSWGQRALL